MAASSARSLSLSMANSPCCAVSEMFMVVYDPATDFTLKPWLTEKLKRPLELGEVVGGTYYFPQDLDHAHQGP